MKDKKGDILQSTSDYLISEGTQKSKEMLLNSCSEGDRRTDTGRDQAVEKVL